LRKPNIVLIMSDQHNAHVMGCAGNAVVQTPALDRLAREGVHFTAAYCPYPLCVPSRMGFMTGRYPSRVDVWDNSSVLSSETLTFAHRLTAAEYETALCGRMHFWGKDQFHGFEKRLYGDCYNFLTPEIKGTGYNRTNGQTRYAVEVAGYGRTGFQAYDANVTARACDFITEYKSSERPYCMVVGHILPHNPLICSREVFEYYLAKLPVPEPIAGDYLDSLNQAIRMWRKRRGADELTPEQQHRGLAAYYGLVTEMDRNVGRIVNAVKASDDADNTVIIYCSDHGDMAGEHGMWWKSCHYEGSARVPLIVSCPSRFRSGGVVDAVVSLIDTGPTLLDIAGAAPLPEVEGRSMAEFLTQDRPPSGWPNEVFCEYIGAHGDKPSCMVRSGPWKLMYYSEFDSCLLFNLEEDPDEVNDRASDPACGEIAEELLARIRGRWSADMMVKGLARESATPPCVVNDELSAPIEHPQPPDNANAFDFLQIPNWERRQAGLNPEDAS